MCNGNNSDNNNDSDNSDGSNDLDNDKNEGIMAAITALIVMTNTKEAMVICTCMR